MTAFRFISDTDVRKVTPTSVPDISAVIPVKNESAGLAACLGGILSQTVPVREIIVIDSGSTDGTQDIARSFDKVRVVEIEPKDFNHGDTRNLGVREARGELVLFTVGDARPVSERWIENLLAGMVDESVVGVSGWQVVPEDKATNPLQWFRPASEPRLKTVRFADTAEFEGADPAFKRDASGWDDVTALYRRDHLLAHPFRRTVYGEDMFFAIDALKAGHTLAFAPAAQVYHFHNETYRTVYKRTLVVALCRYRNLGYVTPVPDMWRIVVRGWIELLRNDRLNWTERWKWARYNFEAERSIRDGLVRFAKAKEEGDAALQALEEEFGATPPAPVKQIRGA